MKEVKEVKKSGQRFSLGGIAGDPLEHGRHAFGFREQTAVQVRVKRKESIGPGARPVAVQARGMPGGAALSRAKQGNAALNLVPDARGPEAGVLPRDIH